MSDQDRIVEARKRLDDQWDNEGDCRSCGWHAYQYEHDISDFDIADALDNYDGWLHLSCVSKDADDSSSHRGAKIFIGNKP